MPSNNDRPVPSPRDQLETLMNESFGERTPRKLFKLCVAEFEPSHAGEQPRFFEEYFYLSDDEAVEVCRGLITGLKPYASRRADRDGRPKNATAPRNQNAAQKTSPKREQPAEELELAAV